MEYVYKKESSRFISVPSELTSLYDQVRDAFYSNNEYAFKRWLPLYIEQYMNLNKQFELFTDDSRNKCAE